MSELQRHQPTAPARPRHLQDPANLRREPHESASLTRVQTWVMSVLAVTTILHLCVGLIVSAAFIDASMSVERTGLLVIAGAFGVLAAVAGLAIHRHAVATPWVLLGLLPGVVGAVVVLVIL